MSLELSLTFTYCVCQLRLEYRNSQQYRKIVVLRFFPVFGSVSVINDMIKTDPELTGGEETDVGAGIVDSSSNIVCLQELEKISRLP